MKIQIMNAIAIGLIGIAIICLAYQNNKFKKQLQGGNE